MVKHGNQRFFAESDNLSRLGGTKRIAPFSPRLEFKIVDIEIDDLIDVEVTLQSPRGTLTYQTTFSMEDFRRRGEEKIELSVPVQFEASAINKNTFSTSLHGSVSSETFKLTGELGMCFVYTEELVEPSLTNFIACGLCLCPQVNPISNDDKHLTKRIA